MQLIILFLDGRQINNVFSLKLVFKTYEGTDQAYEFCCIV